MNSALMTQAEYATHRGVGKSAVSNWKKVGKVVFAEDGEGGLKVDVVRTDAKLNASIDPTRGRPSGGAMAGDTLPAAPSAPSERPLADPDSLGAVRTDLLREQRIGHKLRNAREAGDLVPRTEYEGRIAEMGRLSRERVHSVIRAQAERLAAEHDPRVITALLTAEVDRAFAELADQAEAGAFAAAEEELPDAESAEEPAP